MCLGGRDGRAGGGMTTGLRDRGRGVGTDGLRVATQDPIKKDGKMADPLLRRQGRRGRSQTDLPSEVTQSLSPKLLPFSA